MSQYCIHVKSTVMSDCGPRETIRCSVAAAHDHSCIP